LKIAYVTLLANEAFIPGVRCLARSLRMVGAKAPLLCMIQKSLAQSAREALQGESLELKVVPDLDLSDAFKLRHTNEAIERKNAMTKGAKPGFHVKLLNFLKLHLWDFVEFDKIVFLDADTVIIKNIDHLFEYPAFAAAPNVYFELNDFHRINSGVFVAKPSRQTFDSMLGLLDAPGAYWKRTDQTFLEEYFKTRSPHILGLPYTYNTLQYVWFNLPELWSWESIHVIHYQFEKPWDESSYQSDLGKKRRVWLAPLVDLWHGIDREGRLPQILIDNRDYLKRLDMNS
jgi:alpha-N-acetylglucosamine transferase